MFTDLEIAQKATLLSIQEVAKKFGISPEFLEPYGRYKAKVNLKLKQTLDPRSQGKLILVTAISPTPAGEGKTTTTIGLGDALNRLNKKTIVCLREPSLGPVFGMKGGATGGGYSQVVPMTDINLHFTGDFSAIQLAHNLLSAVIDNHIHHGNELDFDVRRINWKRVVDMNDRALREITIALGGVSNGFPRQDGFDIVVASEVMAIFCLSKSLSDLKTRLGNIVVGYSRQKKPIRAKDLNVHGAMAVLLKDAIHPNIVQTLENNLAFVHGGPFANIAHGCNSVVATEMALQLSDYVVTEAGFGADLGAEKFVHIKCRKSGIRPSAAVVVATIRALKFHGGAELASLKTENLEALKKGFENLSRHLDNVQNKYGIPCVVAINHFETDTEKEIQLLQTELKILKSIGFVCKHWAQGGQGAEELAKQVIEISEAGTPQVKFLYDESAPLWEKAKRVAQQIYGAQDIDADSKVKTQITQLETEGYGSFPVCMAKTPYSFSIDPSKKGAPSNHIVHIREVRLSAGAEFVVFICGDIMTMPGLPKKPSAIQIDIDSNDNVIGLF